MKSIVLLLAFLFQINYFFAQEYKSEIKKEKGFNKIRKSVVLNKEKDTLFIISVLGNGYYIDGKNTKNVVKNNRELLDRTSEKTLAYYKNGIIILNNNEPIVEKREKDVFEYFQNNEKVLSIERTYDKSTKTFYVSIVSYNQSGNISPYLLQLGMSRYLKTIKNKSEVVKNWIMPITIGAVIGVLIGVL